MKYYIVNGCFFKSNSKEDTIALAIESISYGHCLSIADIPIRKEELNNQNLSRILSRYELSKETSKLELLSYMIKSKKIERTTKKEINEIIKSRERFKNTKNYIRQITVKKAIEIFVEFAENNKDLLIAKYPNYSKQETKELTTKKYWNFSVSYSHNLVHEWIEFNLPIS